MKLKFLDRFFKNIKLSNFMKILTVGAELFHADGRTDRQTDMTELTVAFRNYAKVPKDQSGNEVKGKISRLFLDPYKTRNATRAPCRIFEY
jgi:hypothetical protein